MIDLNADLRQSFSHWMLKDSLGRYLKSHEERFFRKTSEDIFGFYAIQLGLSQHPLLNHSRITHGAFIDDDQCATIRSELSQLPFPSESIDLVLLPHTLDIYNEPHHILIEIKRILSPGGYILLTGFNPYSLWGLRHFYQSNKANYDPIHAVPWTSNFIGLKRLKAWLKLLELEIERGSFMVYIPPFDKGLKYFKRMDDMGDRWWPTGAAIYGISIVKKSYAMHPLKPSWKRQKSAPKLMVTTTGNRSSLRWQKRFYDLMTQFTLDRSDKTVNIYTDGACKGNPGIGGWGVLLRYGTQEKELCGGAEYTTNNRMELTAVIEGLSALKRGCNVVVHTDSQYVQKGITQWLDDWKARDWKTSAKKAVKNIDLWQRLDTEIERHHVTWVWIRGHNGHQDNERADKLANQGVLKIKNLPKLNK